jgi:uncharacterized protein (DUF488 family)
VHRRQGIDDSAKGWPREAIFTVGHSNLSIDDFMTLLRAYGIKRLVDIRTIPRSRHNPQFNSEALSHSLKQEKIDYVALPALGGLRHSRKDSPNTGWHNESFRGYADYMQTKDFEDGLKRLQQLSRTLFPLQRDGFCSSMTLRADHQNPVSRAQPI